MSQAVPDRTERGLILGARIVVVDGQRRFQGGVVVTADAALANELHAQGSAVLLVRHPIEAYNTLPDPVFRHPDKWFQPDLAQPLAPPSKDNKALCVARPEHIAVRMITGHWTAGDPPFGHIVFGTVASNGASAHFNIGGDPAGADANPQARDFGTIWQFADPIGTRCWHAQHLNAASIGVEISHPGHVRKNTVNRPANDPLRIAFLKPFARKRTDPAHLRFVLNLDRPDTRYTLRRAYHPWQLNSWHWLAELVACQGPARTIIPDQDTIHEQLGDPSALRQRVDVSFSQIVSLVQLLAGSDGLGISWNIKRQVPAEGRAGPSPLVPYDPYDVVTDEAGNLIPLGRPESTPDGVPVRLLVRPFLSPEQERWHGACEHLHALTEGPGGVEIAVMSKKQKVDAGGVLIRHLASRGWPLYNIFAEASAADPDHMAGW